MIMISI